MYRYIFHSSSSLYTLYVPLKPLKLPIYFLSDNNVALVIRLQLSRGYPEAVHPPAITYDWAS